MKKTLLILFIILGVNCLFASTGSFYLFHNIDLDPNISTEFYTTENQNNPLNNISLIPSVGEQQVGLLIATFNTNFTNVDYIISWGDLELSTDSNTIIPFTMKAKKSEGEEIPITSVGVNGAGSVSLEDIKFDLLPYSTWTRQYVCELDIVFTTDPKIFKAGIYSAEIKIETTI